MYQRDYILRLIEQIGIVLSSVMDLVRSGKLDEALAEIDRVLQHLLGLTLSVAETLDSDDLVGLIRLSRAEGADPGVVAGRLNALARLLQMAGDVNQDRGDAARADLDRLKALDIFLSALFEGGGGTPRDMAAVEQLVAQLDELDLPPRTKEQLWRHYELLGEFARAENWFYELLEDEQAPPDIVERGIAFYERLAARTDEDLRQGNLPRDEVLAGLAQLREG